MLYDRFPTLRMSIGLGPEFCIKKVIWNIPAPCRALSIFSAGLKPCSKLMRPASRTFKRIIFRVQTSAKVIQFLILTDNWNSNRNIFNFIYMRWDSRLLDQRVSFITRLFGIILRNEFLQNGVYKSLSLYETLFSPCSHVPPIYSVIFEQYSANSIFAIWSNSNCGLPSTTDLNCASTF